MVFDEMEIPKGFRAGSSKEELNALVTTDLRGGRRVDPISLRMACRVLQQIPLSKLQLMRTRGKSMSFPAGYPLFIQGDRADALIYLVRGTVNIHSSQPKTSAMGRPNYGPVVDTLEQGVCFGELSLFPEPAIRTVTVVTKDECECVILRRQHIEEEGVSPFQSKHKLELTDSENKFFRKREHLRSDEEAEACYEKLLKHPFFQNLPKLAVLRFLKTMRIVSLSQEDVLFEQSMPANKIFIVTHGSLSLHNLKRKRQLPAKDEFEEAVEEPKDNMQKDKPHPLLAKPAELISDDEESENDSDSDSEENRSDDDSEQSATLKATSLNARLEEVRKLLIIEGALRPESEEDEDPLSLIKTHGECVTVLESGDMVGEIALAINQLYGVTAIARTTCRVLMFTREAFEESLAAVTLAPEVKAQKFGLSKITAARDQFNQVGDPIRKLPFNTQRVLRLVAKAGNIRLESDLEELRNFLKICPALAELANNTINLLIPSLKCQLVEKNQCIVKKGEKLDSLLYVMRGHMTEHMDNTVLSQTDLRRNDCDDEASPRDELLTMSAEENVEELWPGTCTQLIHPGDQIGEKSLTFNILAKSTIITLVDTVVVVLNKTKYNAALRKVEHEARKDKVKFLQSIELFSVIPRQCVDRLCMGMQICEFTEAKKIMMRFMPPDHAYIVYKGSCRELMAAENGELKPGSRTWGMKECIGMSEAAHGVPYHRTVEAEPGTVLFSFMADDLQRHTKGLLRAQLAHPGMPIQTAEEARDATPRLIREDDTGDDAEEVHEGNGNFAEEATNDPSGKGSDEQSETPPAWFLNAKGRGSSTQLGTVAMPNGAFDPQIRLRGWEPIKKSLKSANVVAMFLSRAAEKEKKTENPTKEMEEEAEPASALSSSEVLIDQSRVSIMPQGKQMRRNQLRSLKHTLQVKLADRRARQHLAEPGPDDESQKSHCPAPEVSSLREALRPSSVPHPSISFEPEIQCLSDGQAESRPTTTMSLPAAFITEVSESASIPWPSSHACTPSPRGTPRAPGRDPGPLTINQFPQEVVYDPTLPPSLIRGIMTPGATPRSPDMGRASVVRPAAHASPPPATMPPTQPPPQPAAPESHIRSVSPLPTLSSRKESAQMIELTRPPSGPAVRGSASVPHVRSTKTSRKRSQLAQAAVKSMRTSDPLDALEPQSPPRAAPTAPVWQPGRPISKKPPPKSEPALPQAKLVAYAKNKLGLDPKRDQELLFMAQVAHDGENKLERLLSRREQAKGKWQKATSKIRSAEKMLNKRSFSSARYVGQSTKLNFRSILSNSPDPLPERVHLYEHVRARVKSLNQVVNELYVDDYEYDVTKPGAFIRLVTQLHEHVASREKPNLERESIDHNRCLYRRNVSAPKSMCC